MCFNQSDSANVLRTAHMTTVDPLHFHLTQRLRLHKELLTLHIERVICKLLVFPFASISLLYSFISRYNCKCRMSFTAVFQWLLSISSKGRLEETSFRVFCWCVLLPISRIEVVLKKAAWRWWNVCNDFDCRRESCVTWRKRNLRTLVKRAFIFLEDGKIICNLGSENSFYQQSLCLPALSVLWGK